MISAFVEAAKIVSVDTQRLNRVMESNDFFSYLRTNYLYLHKNTLNILMKKILAYIAFSFTAITSYATTPLWMRDVQISPDGTEIVFCYKGDIYKVPTEGGAATQLTTQDSYECTPVWSPDGKQIAFASDRNGNFDIL